MWPYALVYLGSALVDCIPIFAPPAWMLMIFLMMKFNLNPWITVTLGTFGTVTGRMIFITYIVPWIGKKTLARDKESDLTFLGKKLSQRGWPAFLFVFIYSILPLSTTALFTAAGLAKVRRLFIIPPFFLGNFIGDAFLIISGKNAVRSTGELFKGSWDLKNILLMALGLALMLGLLFVDWRTLLTEKKLKVKWQFWK
jgi:hypothetical protein